MLRDLPKCEYERARLSLGAVIASPVLSNKARARTFGFAKEASSREERTQAAELQSYAVYDTYVVWLNTTSSSQTGVILSHLAACAR